MFWRGANGLWIMFLTSISSSYLEGSAPLVGWHGYLLNVTSFGSTQVIELWSLYLISAKIVFIATDFSFMVAESLIRTLQCSFSLCRRTHFELHLGLSMDSLHLAGSTFRSLRSTSLDLCSERFSLSSLQNLKKCRNRYFVRMTHKKKGWLQLCILINSLTVTLIWNNEYQ